MIDEGIVTVVNDVHSFMNLLQIRLIDLGIFICANDEHLHNAYESIVIKDEGSDILLRDLHS